ncbi:MAG: BTAD domain-containing putative transcriptional regulator, partial [Chloroflexota bacterium]
MNPISPRTKVLRLALMGQFVIDMDAEPVPLASVKAQALLCYLAVSGRAHSRQALAGLLWGDLPEADARRNLRGVLLKLREIVGDYLQVTPQTILFDVGSTGWLDVSAYRALLQKGDLNSLAEATELYRGDFLEDFHVRQALAFEEWVMQQREDLRQSAVAALTTLAAGFEASGHFEKGVGFARRLLLLDPANEGGHRLLMRLLARQGQRSAALAQYDACVAVLAEMGVEPAEETAVLLSQIRANSLAPTPAPPPLLQTPPQPVGYSAQLPHFVAGPPITHPSAFFGREREIKRIMNLVRYLPMQNAAVIGPRRSGKTSLLHHLKHVQPQPGPLRWIFVDFQDTRMGALPHLLRYLLENMHITVPEPCDLEAFMDVVSEELETPTVILMDEIGVALQRYPDLDDAFWESLRSLATNQVGGKLAFVLAGAESPEQLAVQSGLGSPFFNIFGYVAALGPLTEAEALALIAHSPRPFSSEDIAWILQASGRWPILLQIL